MRNKIETAAEIIKLSKKTTAFTGAGISVESGIPPFRGKNGLWSKYDPIILELDYFKSKPEESWKVIKKIFYDFFGKAKPNTAHNVLAKMEAKGLLNSVITQNIDNLHYKAGSKNVYEFHGNSNNFVCLKCGEKFKLADIVLTDNPPYCEKCGGLLKPDFIFFGEGIPAKAYSASIEAANTSNVFLLIGTTGEVMPASQIPFLAKQNGAKIIEVNTEMSNYTNSITDIFLQGKATEIMKELSFALSL